MREGTRKRRLQLVFLEVEVHIESTFASEVMNPAYHNGSIGQNKFNPGALCIFSIQRMDVCSILNLLNM